MGIKNFLAYTNPITLALGIPTLCGIIVGAMTHRVVKDTTTVVKELDKTFM